MLIVSIKKRVERVCDPRKKKILSIMNQPQGQIKLTWPGT